MTLLAFLLIIAKLLASGLTLAGAVAIVVVAAFYVYPAVTSRRAFNTAAALVILAGLASLILVWC